MLGAAIIVFREVLEAALIIGIIAAATRGLPRRGVWIGSGVLLGVGGACVVAAFTGFIANLASGMGQELFNAGVLCVAVAMLAWHNIWMAAHGRELASVARQTGQAVTSGTEPVTVLLVVISMAVLREGSEVALFLYGIFAQGGVSATGMALGSLLGLAAGVVLGFTLYAGLLRIPMRWFFGVTSALILLLAAGMAGQAARLLIQAGYLPALADPLWDSSALVDQGSVLGNVLHALAGYDAQPTGMHVLVYVTTAILILIGMLREARQPAAA